MSAKRHSPPSAWAILTLAVLVGAGYALAEENADQADIELLEYLGSWADSEEDWLIFVGGRETRDESDVEEKEETAPDGEKLAEVKDEE